MSRCLHLLWNLLRYGRWTTCAHTASIEIYDVRAALGHGVRYVPPEQWRVCGRCKVVLSRKQWPRAQP